MALCEEFETTGNWLFRWRSYLPLLLFIPLALEIRHFHLPRHSQQLQFVWELCCLAVSLCGFAIRIKTVGHRPSGTSGRNTKHQIADSLNTTGMYSIFRHPLYVGNFLMWLGIAMFCMDWRLLVIFVLSFALYYERIMFAEEAFLCRTFGARFNDWAAKTPSFLPRYRNWRRPALPFSVRTTLKQEYSSLLALVLAFLVLEVAQHFVTEGRLTTEPFWVVLGTSSLLVYLGLRFLKKHTLLLHVEGR